MKNNKEEKIRQCLNCYEEMFSQYEIEIPENGLLAGFHNPIFMEKQMDILFPLDNMHYPMGNACLTYGVGGIIVQAQKTADRITENQYIKGVGAVYRLISKYIGKHKAAAEEKANQADTPLERERCMKIAERCGRITEDKATGFAEALQLFWFLYLFRSPFCAGCIGRLDQTLYPFYVEDVERGQWKREEAIEMIVQMYEKMNRMNTGDTLRNLMLSGQDKEGRDTTNELTYLFLEAYQRTNGAEPHLNVRIHGKTPKRLKELCIEMLSEGSGQPTLYYDAAIMPAMEKAGIAHEDACDYANDGCTETVIDKKSGIVFWQHEMVKTVELTVFNGQENPSIYPVEVKKSSKYAPSFTPCTGLTLGFASGDIETMNSFTQFKDAFFRQLDYQLDRWLCLIDKKITEDEQTGMTSLMVAGTFEKCILTGKDPLHGGGFEVSNYQLLSGSVTTAGDCLRAVEYCVFEKKDMTLAELKRALAADFVGYEGLRQKLLHAPKYGNAEKRADELTAEIAGFFLEKVNTWKSRSGKRVYPGFYNIDFIIFSNITGATPDGRRFRDPIAEHCSPTPGAAQSGPTAIMTSASRIPMEYGFASSPLHITLDKSSFIMGADKKKILRTLFDVAEQYQIPVLSLTMYDKKELYEAKRCPLKHQDIIVRVWGFQARFVDLDEELQNHIINRIG